MRFVTRGNGRCRGAAPAAFGPFGGDIRRENYEFISSVHWTEGDAQALLYPAEIVRRDADGKEYVFVSNIQAGQNLIAFAGDRMILANTGQSYSSGTFKQPDWTVFAPKRADPHGAGLFGAGRR